MTCIAALECSDGAIIAGDFCGSNGFTYESVVPAKVFKHSGIMFGYTSTFRFGQIIEHVLDNNSLYPPTDPDGTYRWLVKEFVPKLRKVLKDEEYPKGGNAILVVNDQVWELQDDMSVLRYDTGLTVVGSGTYHAQSSILTQLWLNHSTKKPTMAEAENMMHIAFEITGSCVSSVSTKVKTLRSN